MRWRPVLLTAHLWVGMVAAPFLLVLGVTGAAMVFENEIDGALNAKVTRVSPGGPALSLAALQAKIDGTYPGYRIVFAAFPDDDRHAYQISAVAPQGSGEADLFVDPHTGRIVGTDADVRPLMQTVHGLHTHLLAGRTGSAVVGWGAVVLALLALSGLVLWWPAKVVGLGPAKTAKRLVFDLHNTVGSISFVFLLAFAVTGAVIHWDGPSAALLQRLTRAPSPPAFPRDVPECQGREALPPDALLAAAAAAVPGARPTFIQVPPGARPVRVNFKYPEDHTPAGRTIVFLAGCTGRAVAVRDARRFAPAVRYSTMWNREIHTGDLFGWPTRILMCLFSLSLPVMALTGPLIWWTRRRR